MNGRLERLAPGESGKPEPGALLHLLVDNLPDSYLYQYVFGSDGKPRFTYISAGVERVHGLKPAEVLQDPACYLAQLPPAWMPAQAAAGAETAPNLIVCEMDLLVRRADGGERLLHVQSWPGRTPEGQVLWNGLAADVTGRKTAEEDRLKAFVSETFEGAVESEAGRIVACNERFAQMLGYTVQELQGKLIGELVAPEDRSRVLANIAPNYEIVVNHAMLRKDGSRIIVEAHGCPIGLSRRRFSAVRDITACRLAKQALARREEHLQLILATAQDGFWMADTQGRFLEVNAATWAMTGYSREELLAMSLEDLAAGPAQDQIPARLRDIRDHGRALSFEGRLRRKDGRLVELELSVNFLNEEGGRFFAFMRDLSARKLAEAKLLESETQFRLVFESAGIGIALVDMQGRPVGSNPAFQKILGYSAEELNRMPFTEFTHPDDRERDYDLYQELKAGKRERYEMEKRYIRKDGEIVTGLLTVSLVKDTQGRPQYALAMVQDITERKWAEALLKESETRFRTLIEQAPTAISISRNGITLYVNQKFLEIFGSHNPDEYVGRPIIEHWAPESHPIIAERIRRCSLGLPVPPTFEGMAQRQDGSRFRAHVALTVANLADGSASLAFITDITERKQAEEANSRLAAIVESSEDAIISKTMDGTIVSWNHGAEKLFGYTAQEAVGRNILLIIPPDRSNEEPDILARIARSETVEHFETVRLTKSGRPVPVSVTISPILNAAGQITGASKIARDITERNQAEEALRRARDELARANAGLERKVAERTAQLAEANANLETFAYTAAHDLRAPLRGITNFAQVLAEEYGQRLDEMGCSMLERMGESARQMGQLLNDLLEYSRVTQQELRLEKVNLEGAVREVLGLLESDIHSKQAEVRVEGPLPEVIAHPATLVMLISNLVSNGLKFVPQGVKPQVRIWARPTPPPECALPDGQRGESRFVRLWVEDKGIGIAPEDLGAVFGTFRRLHGKNTYPGTGLGLAIVRKGAERMGGQTGVGKGSRFWIELKGTEVRS